MWKLRGTVPNYICAQRQALAQPAPTLLTLVVSDGMRTGTYPGV